MDIIEQAAKRLEELRQAGVEVPGDVLPREGISGGGEAPVHRDEDRRFRAASGTQSPPQTAVPAATSRRIEIDMQALTASNVVTPDAGRSRLADEMRVIKRPLLRNVAGNSAAPIRHANLIMITSAVPGEGKTTIAANLAMSIAMELDHTVLLVDADVARPAIPRVFGFDSHEKGLLDLLTDDLLEPSKVLLRTNVEKLSILPSGTQHPRATELLASAAMTELLDDMARRYADRVIIFDSPPLLLTTEARALAAHMGQVVLVVRAESTMRSEVTRALGAIENCPVKMVLLNGATGGFDEHGYGYGYGYGGYGYDTPEPGEKGAAGQ